MRASVLIVEDEVVLRRSLAVHLERCGLGVAEAGSLAEARVELTGRSFDALVLDLGLPDGDGLELLEPERADRALVVTARPDPARFAGRGVVHHLAKPVDLDEVLARLTSICAASGRAHGRNDR